MASGYAMTPNNWREYVHHRFSDAASFHLSEQSHPFGITVRSTRQEVKTWILFIMDEGGAYLHDVQVCLPGLGTDPLYFDLDMIAGESLLFSSREVEDVEGMLEPPLRQGWLEQQFSMLGEVHKRVIHYGRNEHPVLRQITRSGILDRLLDVLTLGRFSALSQKREVFHPPME